VPRETFGPKIGGRPWSPNHAAHAGTMTGSYEQTYMFDMAQPYDASGGSPAATRHSHRGNLNISLVAFSPGGRLSTALAHSVATSKGTPRP